jgi:hypothetical protein
MKNIRFIAGASLVLLLSGSAEAKDWPITIANNGSVELARPSSVVDCQSYLASPPTAEMLVGHPNLRLSLKEKPVMPVIKTCTKEVPGAILSLIAEGIKEPSTATIVVRWRYVHKDGAITYRGKKFVVTMTP